ncbi:MAG: prenyltransferase/squalene oxidase repeat-containing protein [Planctomycetota bacterium]
MTRHTLRRLVFCAGLGLGLAALLAAPAMAGEEDTDAYKKARMADDAYSMLGRREAAAVSPGKDPAFLVLPRATERSTMPDKLLTPLTEQMIEQTLTYLSNRQDPDGGWSDTHFQSNAGVTALVCLAFMAEGSRPRIGKYGKQIDRGMEFLLKNVESSGVIAAKGRYKHGPMYGHMYSMLALLYAYGDMPWRGKTRDVIARGIQAIARSQRLDGGWRYQFSREGAADMSVTANVLWVMRTAKKCGFTVDSKAIEKGVQFIQQCALPDGTFRYRVWGLEASPSLGGTGIIALCNHGRIDHPLIMPARDRIEYDYRRYTVKDLTERRYYAYGCFYASIAMYMCGDQYWVPWYRKATAVLRAMQRKDGEIPDKAGNTVYTTAMAAMVLQAPYGYLPLYER